MGLSNVYTIAGMQSGSTVFKDIRSQTLNPQLTTYLLGSSGTGYRTFVGVGQISPIIDFTSGDVKTLLASMTNQIALAISSNFYIWFQKMTEGGLRSSGSTHYKGTIAEGMMIPVNLRMRDGADAELSCQIIMTSSDGSSSPLTLAGSQALVSSAGAASGWTLGPVSLNGTTLEGVEEVSIDFGIRPVVLGASGLVYHTFVGVMEIDPTIRITAAGIDEFLTWGLAGTAQSATDSTIQIQDIAEGGVRGTSPITCSIDEGIMYADGITSQDGQPTRQSIVIKPTYDGVALPLAWTGLT